MDSDDLDNLIADSLGGVQSALEGERKAAQPAASSQSALEGAKDAVQELKDGSRSDSAADAPNEEFFSNLIKTFQDEKFQQAMAEALQGATPSQTDSVAAEPAAASGEAADPEEQAAAAPPTAPSGGNAAASSSTDGAEEFLQGFLKNFDQAVGSDETFEKSLTSMLTSMLSNDLVCDPLQQIASKLEPWLKAQKSLSQADRARYEGQLRIYKQVLNVYSSSPDPLPDAAREEVQRLLQELHSYGQPPDEIMNQISPKDAEEGQESFEDFVKSMGLDSSLGKAEHDLLQKLSEDPEELTKVMKEMSNGIPEEACKQQ